ncbi:MAG: ABC transporter ATP-binding protein [Gemmatimonadetes bacterium]|nr:ABC transporter ATP-binding protein [Gemmatimonadota bacterium]
MTGPAVSVERLTRSFGPLTAVSNISFEVANGELFGIVGPDGAGKTTTLRMLAGILPPSAGTIRVGEVEAGGHPERAKLSLAYMAQRFGLYEDLTVAENLAFYADLYRVPRDLRPARIERLYRFSRLGEFQGRLAGHLSGGMKQKLSLSCCLIHSPSVLLLDEPTFGVDPISRRELWLILHERVAEGITVILSTSYMEEAERCDRVALLHQGGILALDRPRAIQESLEGRMLALRVSLPRAARDVLRNTPGVRGASLFGDTVHALLDPGVPDEVAATAVRERGIELRGSEAIRPSLEDMFIHLVGAADGH